MAQPSSDPSTVTYSGVATTLTAWGFHLSDVVAVIGLVVAIIGLCAQLYYVWLVKQAMKNGKDLPD